MKCNFYAMDSWFFKESRPMESMGSSEMQSLFPPTPYSMSGILRSIIGEQLGVDWQAYRQGDGKAHAKGALINLCDLMGNPKTNGLGELRLAGSFLTLKDETLFPAPLSLMQRSDTSNPTIHAMDISTQLERTDLGLVRLPTIAPQLRGAKVLDKHFISLSGLENYLNGILPKPEEIHAISRLKANDPRLGIQLASATKTTIEGQLYQTNHLRLKEHVSLVSYFDGIPQEIFHQTSDTVRFGAEGRVACYTLSEQTLSIKPPAPTKNTQGLILTLLSHANLNGSWLPEAFIKSQTHNGQCVWQGQIHGVRLTLHSSIIGKAVREGGWDIAAHKPKPLLSLIPAGSQFYVTLDEGQELTDAIESLHLKQIGEETQLGRGLMACALWNK